MQSLILNNLAVIDFSKTTSAKLSACDSRASIGRIDVICRGERCYVICFMLNDDTDYVLSYADEHSPLRFRTGKSSNSLGPLHVTFEHLPYIEIIARTVPGEFLVTNDWSVNFWVELLSRSLFTLPMSSVQHELILLPCPEKRYCITDFDAKQRQRKLKKYHSLFDIRVNSDFELALRTAADWHRGHNGTWLSSSCVANLLSIYRSQNSKVRMVSFEAWEKATGELAAVSLGYSCGLNFHDFSACTIIRDKRSIGTILLERQRELLAQAGCKLWYLGFKIPYMQFLNGSELDSKSFFELWDDGSKHGNNLTDALLGGI